MTTTVEKPAPDASKGLDDKLPKGTISLSDSSVDEIRQNLGKSSESDAFTMSSKEFKALAKEEGTKKSKSPKKEEKSVEWNNRRTALILNNAFEPSFALENDERGKALASILLKLMEEHYMLSKRSWEIVAETRINRLAFKNPLDKNKIKSCVDWAYDKAYTETSLQFNETRKSLEARTKGVFLQPMYKGKGSPSGDDTQTLINTYLKEVTPEFRLNTRTDAREYFDEKRKVWSEDIEEDVVAPLMEDSLGVIHTGLKHIFVTRNDDKDVLVKGFTDIQRIQLTEPFVRKFINVRMSKNKYDPFLDDYLYKLPKWDGVNRIEPLIPNVFVVSEEEKVFAGICSRITFLGAVQRALSPLPVVIDVAPVLYGLNNIGKGNFFKYMVPYGFYEGEYSFKSNSKETVEKCSGKVIVESSEMQDLSSHPSMHGPVKAMMSLSDARARLSYRRNPKNYKFLHVLVGTTNEKLFLPDVVDTHRRFCPIEVGIHQKGWLYPKRYLEQHKDQLMGRGSF